ncbi:MAG TPA: hypothetical protein VHN12_12000, partial [Geobacteraceae bacterium]|nr:hypothetical protein [Geobacteraceae bacterium]
PFFRDTAASSASNRTYKPYIGLLTAFHPNKIGHPCKTKTGLAQAAYFDVLPAVFQTVFQNEKLIIDM